MKITIYDVAERASVSIATVSRVLNGHSKVTENTRARVLQAAKELSYRPNPVARGLALQATGTLALIVETFNGIYPGQVIGGAETEAATDDYHLLVYQINSREPEQLMDLPGRTDGLIASGSFSNDELLKTFSEQDTPTVVMGHPRPELGMDGIVPDNYGGGYAATEHLIEHGYQRIAHIAGPDRSGHARDRRRGYLAALGDHDIAAQAEYIIEGDYTHEGGEQAMTALLNLPEPPDAVFAGNDLMALGAYLAIERQGLTVPDDVALIGFDGLDTGAYVSPPLTTVYQPMEEQGREAVKTLIWRMANPDAEVREVLLPTKLMVRSSCGCPAVSRIQEHVA